jgi:hypothetical protein
MLQSCSIILPALVSPQLGLAMLCCAKQYWLARHPTLSQYLWPARRASAWGCHKPSTSISIPSRRTTRASRPAIPAMLSGRCRNPASESSKRRSCTQAGNARMAEAAAVEWTVRTVR